MYDIKLTLLLDLIVTTYVLQEQEDLVGVTLGVTFGVTGCVDEFVCVMVVVGVGVGVVVGDSVIGKVGGLEGVTVGEGVVLIVGVGVSRIGRQRSEIIW